MYLAPCGTAHGDVDANGNENGDDDPGSSASAVAAQDATWPRCSRPAKEGNEPRRSRKLL